MLEALLMWGPYAAGLIGAVAMFAGTVVAPGRGVPQGMMLLGSGMLVAGLAGGGVGAILFFSGSRSLFDPKWDLAMELAGFIDFLGIFLFGLGFLWFRLRRRAGQSP